MKNARNAKAIHAFLFYGQRLRLDRVIGPAGGRVVIQLEHLVTELVCRGSRPAGLFRIEDAIDLITNTLEVDPGCPVRSFRDRGCGSRSDLPKLGTIERTLVTACDKQRRE